MTSSLTLCFTFNYLHLDIKLKLLALSTLDESSMYDCRVLVDAVSDAPYNYAYEYTVNTIQVMTFRI